MTSCLWESSVVLASIAPFRGASHNCSPDRGYIFPEITVLFYKTNSWNTSDESCLWHRSSGEAEWTATTNFASLGNGAMWKQAFYKCFCCIFLRSHKLNACYDQPVLKWNLHTLFWHCPCLFLAVTTQNAVLPQRGGMGHAIEGKIRLWCCYLLRYFVFQFSTPACLLVFMSIFSTIFMYLAVRNFFRNWCTFLLT